MLITFVAIPCLAAPVAAETNEGLVASYYTNEEWTGNPVVNIAPRIWFADDEDPEKQSDVANWPAPYIGITDHFSVKYIGYLNVPTEDSYTFYLTSDDGSWLWLDGTQVIDNGGDHSPTEKSCMLLLTEGLHPIKIQMYDNTGGATLHLNWSNDTSPVPVPIPADSFSHTIQQRINEAPVGDTIVIDSGTYSENLIANKTITLRGNDSGSGFPLFNGGNNAPAITIESDNVVLQNLNISGNSLTNGYGAGVKAVGTSANPIETLTIDSCVFAGNVLNGLNLFGGGLYAGYVNDIRLEDTDFSNNQADQGAGCYFISCGNAVITGSTYTGNAAKYGGGCYFSSSSSAMITRTAYTDNTAGSNGGGCYWYNSPYADIINTTYAGNAAKVGGGCYFYNSRYTGITNATFTDNTATNYGGGSCFTGSANAAITSSAYSGNTATNRGGACYFSNSADAVITDTTYTGNSATIEGGGCCLVTASNNAAFTNISADTNDGDDFSATSECTGVSFTNLTLGDADTTSVSFTFGGGMKISGATGTPPTDPTGFGNISHFVKVIAPGWMLLNVSYTDADVAGLNASSLTMWNTTGGAWGEVAGTNGVNTAEKYVYANLEDLSEWHIIAPFAALTGSLRVNSTPTGATIHLNGTDTGETTNATLTNKPVGTYTVSVEKPGYEAAEQVVTIVQDQTATVDFTLAEITLWNVSAISGVGNYSNVSDIPEISDGDTVQIWGIDGHTYEGGFTLGVANVTIKEWEGSPVRPLLTNTSHTASTITITADNVTLSELNISGNSPSTHSGAGIMAFGEEVGPWLEKLTITDCTFAGNEMSSDHSNGGGIYAVFVNDLLIENSEFSGNTVTNSGGGCYFHGTSNASITNSSFTSNTAPGGGGCWFELSNNVIITNTTYTNNTADVYGGGCLFYESDDGTFTNTTYIDNSAEVGGGCLFVSSSDAILTDTIARNNSVSDFTSFADCTGITFNNLTLGEGDTTSVSFTYGGAMNITGTIGDAPDDPTGYTNISHYVKVQAPDWMFLNVSYRDADVAGLNASSLTMWNTTGGAWGEVAGTNGVNTAEKYVYANLIGWGDSWNVIAPLGDVTGEFCINSTPSGGWVWIDGVNRSVHTNASFSGILPDVNHNVTVKLDDYHAGINESVNVSKSGTTDVFFALAHETGDLRINSTPSGASVYLNGTDTGEFTNVTLADKPVGTYNVTVELAGYDSASQVVTLSKDETEDVSFTLVEQLGTLQINSTPAGAIVYLNGIATGDFTNVTLADKPAGTYNVTVELDGYDSASQTVTLAKNETEDVSFTLVEQLGTLQINSTPSGAIVYLNGTATGDLTNVTLSGKPVGVYNVTVLKDGYDSASQLVTLAKDETEYLSFTLVEQLGTLQINSTPSGAIVYLNGTATGDLTNVILSGKPVGVYNVTVLKDGYDSASQTVTLAKDETEYLSFTLVEHLGTLQINSTPSGAIVYLNGTATGDLTNVTLSGKPVGVYNVTVLKDGYDSASQLVTLTKDETEDMSFTLVEQLGTLQINSTPAGAIVYLNGTATGDLTNVTLSGKPVGVYNVTVLKDGYDSSSQIVTLSKDETEDVSFTLVEQLGTLQINSTPSGAIVYLNGTATGDLTNVTLSGKPVGVYNVTVELDGYDSTSQIVTLAKDETEDVSFTLVEQLGTLQINSTPSGAIVYLNGTATGDLTNVTLAGKSVGVYNVTVELDGYDSASQIVTLTKDETEDVSFTLVQQLGNLQVNSTPSGAIVYLNGTATGDLTNVTLSGKPVGVYNVTVELDGYDSTSQIVTLAKDETEDVSFTLVQQLGTLQINSTPSGAIVYLNGTATGDLTNVTLSGKPVGVYNVTVQKDGYDSASQIVTLKKDETEDVSFTLVQQLGNLQVNSTPSGAIVYLNGTATGDLTNVTLSGKPVGVYNVTVLKDGYDSASQIVTLFKDETEDVSFTLVEQLGTLQINSTPAGAIVYLNGTATGDLTNVTLSGKPVGVYNVTVLKDGYDSSSQIVTLSKDETEDVSFTLVEQLGTLQINSTPSGAIVYLNGTATGDHTNVTLSGKPVGVYNVTVLKDGYDSVSRIVTLVKDETEDVSFTLVEQVGTLQINSTPSGALVYLNGTATGDLTNVTLSGKPVGVYNVTVLKDGYDSSSQIVTLSKDETEDVSFTLVEQLGTLQINSTPSGAIVYLNGTATGDHTNVTLSSKPVGVYNVTIQKDGYDSASQIVTLFKDETEDVSFTLVEQVGTLQINSTPSGALVYLNGTATGDLTNVTLSGKPVGVYNVTVELGGYDSFSQIVTLVKDETEDVSFTLVQQLGTLQINSTPSGAIVYLNGTATGDLTNVTFSGKSVGVYNVTVQKDGYDSASQIVTLTKDETEDVSFTLVKQVGTLQINSTPSGAIVYLNGSATGDLTNVTLSDKPVGVYNVTVELDGYDSFSQIVTLAKDETEDVSFTLVEQVGTLQINSTPSGAIVYLNGTATGDLTNVTLSGKPVGVYNVTVQKDGYDSASQTVTLAKDETEDVSFTLVEQVGTLQINSTPSGAIVYLNGTATGDLTNVTLSGKPVGVYNVTVELGGYDPASQLVTLAKDETEYLSFTLVEHLGTLQINSTPFGALVYLNGTATGDLTNVTLAGKLVGVYNVTIQKDGYDSASQIVTLTKNETEDVSFSLVQQLGNLQVNSTPSGAIVYLNGTATGDLTNVTLSGKPVGVYNVTVLKDGYDSASQIVTLFKDETEDVSFTLVEQLGTLQINSTPAGAIVYLNGTATGDLTNVTLSGKPVGVYNVTVLKDGYDSSSQIVTLSKDETEDVSFTLVEQLGTLQINSTPSGAIVYLNGTATGDHTNVTLSSKPVGVYNVTIQKDGYDSASQIVTLSKDETEDVSFTLVEQVGTLQINSTPAGAIVYLNGTATGDFTNVTLSGKPVGVYNVTVLKDGYDSSSQIVTLSKDETEDVSFILVEQLGTLQINSTPAGAIVYLNGTATGDLTNVTLSGKPVGVYNVTVQKDGYDSASQIVTLAKDETEDVSFTLVEQLGTLQINSTPAGAIVYLNGTATGDLTNVTLSSKPVGVYNVTVELDGYDSFSQIVTLSKDETEDVSFTLVKQVGTLQINSTPSGAIVYLNGSATGDLTNVTLSDKPVGVYNVMVELDGYDSVSRIVTLTKDETEDIGFTLVQQLGTLQVNSIPSGASVYLNGTDTGALTNVTLADKPVGTYNVTVELAGYDSSSQIVTLAEDETEYMSFTLVEQVGTLQINSTPSGASVYLNGTATGDLTDVTLSGKAVGVYNVTILKDGYDSASQLVTLAKDETEDISFTLVQQVGTLQINSTPSGASVYLNSTASGDLTNVTLSDKPVGVYNVTVLKDGYDSASQIVTLSKDETEYVSFTLVEQLGTLQINSTPSGAIVYLNGSATGDLTNVTLSGKPVGVYNVTVLKVGYDSSSQIVTLTKDETEDVSFTLVQQLGTLQINSTPFGAIVYLNGSATGDLTNVTLSGKPVGVYNVTVLKVGYDSASQIVTLAKDETEAISFTLVQQLGTLQINSTPSGAIVYLNGTATGDLRM